MLLVLGLLVRPIVQLVERAAHNGFVVGSNPARPILFDYLEYRY